MANTASRANKGELGRRGGIMKSSLHYLATHRDHNAGPGVSLANSVNVVMQCPSRVPRTSTVSRRALVTTIESGPQAC